MNSVRKVVEIRTGEIIPFRRGLWKILRPSLKKGMWTLVKTNEHENSIEPTAEKTRVPRSQLIRILTSELYLSTREEIRNGPQRHIDDTILRRVRGRKQIPRRTHSY